MKSVLSLIFSRKVFSTLFLVLQLLFIALTITGIYEATFLYYGSMIIISVAVIIYEINREVTSTVKLIWIAIVGLVPIFGVFLYIYVHMDIIIGLMKKKLTKLSQKVSKFALSHTGDITQLKEENPSEYGIFNYLIKNAYAPAFKCEKTEYFPLGEDMFQSLLQDIKSAKKYIFIEMFIINQDDTMWKLIYEALKEKAGSGVEVRLLYDAMGSLAITKNDFVKTLRKQGIKCHAFSPVKPFISTYHNNRDHRKIIIIDGKYAYTGGVNFADEYINRKNRFGHWKDTAIKVYGEAVKGFLIMYLKLWNLVCSAPDDYSRYLHTVSNDEKTGGYICAFDDTPVDGETITKNVLMHIINLANDYVYISTPYLVLDSEVLESIKFAAKRGVDIRICMPHIPDKWYAFAVARTYYPELIKSGVAIFEYTPGFLHAKSTVSDDKRAYVGSANYDFRSLYHNFECGAYVYDNEVIDDIKSDYLKMLGISQSFTLEDYKKLNIFYRLAGRILKLFAPLL